MHRVGKESKGSARVLTGTFVFGITLATLGGWATYSSQFLGSLSAEAAATSGTYTVASVSPEHVASIPQHTSNSDSKADRLPLAETATAESAPPAPVVVAPVAITPATAPQLTAERPTPQPAPRPEKPKASAAPKTLLSDAQIAGLRERLKLTASQQEYWPAVEVALKDVARQLARKGSATRGNMEIDTNSPEVQRLTWAAVPLIMRMGEDQKREVRTLARIIGLESVASQI